MKYCPQCNAQYEYEMSFCLEDGSPLEISAVAPAVENNSEKTLELTQNTVAPSSENTLILPVGVPAQPNVTAAGWNEKQTENIPLTQNIPNQPAFATKQFDPAPRKSNLGLLLGILTAGFVFIAVAIGAVLFFQSQPSKEFAAANTNFNTNTNNQIQVNNANSDAGVNAQKIFSDNSNPQNKPVSNSTEKPTPKTTETPDISTKPTIKPTETTEPTPAKTSTPTPVPTPAKTPPPEVPKVVSGGVVNGKAVNLVRPPYPPAARAVRASGLVSVQVVIDENGNVISANAISGHPLLKQSAEAAARASKFSPTVLAGQRVKVTGVVVYNFQP